LNSAKANFDSIYTFPDPREYYRVLYGLDYIIPDLAKPVIRGLIASLRYHTGRSLKVLDVGCSYGINAALTRYPFDLARLARRYGSPEMNKQDSASLMRLDRHYFCSWPSTCDARFIGLDSSEPALHYALNAGLLDAAVSANLEHCDPTPREAAVLEDVDMVISTGCVGYVTERTFRRVLGQQKKGRVPWVVNFVLRMFPYTPIEEELSRFGLVTEKLQGVTFVQRRFHSEAEATGTLQLLDRRGIDVTGKEAEGLLHAELYVSRPAKWVERVPLHKLVSVTSGAGRRYGRRYARQGHAELSLVH
ncbi:MAG: class I SAM-dependent methyltransferase, partial [Solirubrobacteraceae bacterium]